MSSKATSAWLQRLQLAGFVEYECGPAAAAVKRRLFVPSGIHAVLSGGTSQPPGFPCAAADLMFHRYRVGNIIHCTRRPQGKGDFKWLENHDEVWVMCFKGAGVPWRMLGRFARPNLFVGLFNVERGELSPWSAYQAKAAGTIADWDAKFPGCDPYRGTKFEDYLGSMVFSEDD